MTTSAQITKDQLLKVIDDLQSRPVDRVRILGDASITAVGAGLGAAAAGSAATLAGATSIPVLSTAAGWLGVTAVAATPVGWVIGATLAGGAVAYGVSRLIRNGGMSEGRQRELLQIYKERLLELQRREQAGTVSDADRGRFFQSMREIVDKKTIAPEQAFRLIEAVESGAMPLSQAYELIAGIVEGNQAEQPFP